MDPDQNAINLIACFAAAAFFAAFLLTFWSNKLPLALATALYGCGILGCLSPYAYYHFFRGATSTEVASN